MKQAETESTRAEADDAFDLGMSLLEEAQAILVLYLQSCRDSAVLHGVNHLLTQSDRLLAASCERTTA